MMAMSLAWRLSGALLGALVPIVAAGATATVPKVTKARTSVSSRMDYGPFLSYSVSLPRPPAAKSERGSLPAPTTLASKGITINVGNGATVCFDTATLQMAAGWAGGFLDLSRTNIGQLKGDTDAIAAGRIWFSTPQGPGWAHAGSFTDPRRGGLGPLPRSWAHYNGLYRYAEKVVLSYSVGDAQVLELPASADIGDGIAFTRTMRVSRSSVPLVLRVCDAASGSSATVIHLKQSGASERSLGATAVSILQPAPMTIAAIGLPPGANLQVSGGNQIELHLPATKAPITFKLILAPAAKDHPVVTSDLLKAESRIEDLPSLCHGGPALWGPTVDTQGHTAPETDKAYVVDTLALPDQNPWHSWIRPSGLDFFPDGRCAVCTLNGDVWIVSGIDKNLEHLTWRRFAAGLYEPLGLKIVNNEIYLLGRDQITRLHDLNNDGEADFYENFNNDQITSPIYHAFAFDLQVDSRGSFFYVVDGNAVPLNVPLHGCVLKVSPDGSKSEVYATGLRAANGTGMGPNDELVCSDNQGHWTPVCRINLIKPGGFYGYNGDPRVVTKADIARQRRSYDVPLCWIPYEKDNSTGGQAFATDPRWGPLHGLMLSTSYGKCKLFEVMSEQVDGVVQGASVELPLGFSSGIMRARFNPADGQLYVCGLKGWQTSASRDGCLQRVRYTGKPATLPVQLHVKSAGIAITFATPLDPKMAGDEQNFGIEQWNYKWSDKYGSSKYKPGHPEQVGTDEVEIKSAKLLPDGRTVFLEIPDIHPVMQMSIQVHLATSDGTPIECDIDPTINHVPNLALPPVLTSP
jgi:hypothetical protein